LPSQAAELLGIRCDAPLGTASRCRKAPGAEIESIEGDAEEVGGNEAELRGAHTDDANYGAINGADDPALPEFAPEQDRAKDGKDTRDVVQTNQVVK